MEITQIDIDKILFTDIIDKYNKKYYLVYYNSVPDKLVIHLKNITINKIKSLGSKNHIKIIISKKQITILDNIEKKIINFISVNKNKIYTDNVSIDKLFFSNTESSDNKYILNLSVDKNNSLTYGVNININLNVEGIWLYENMFGISYSINND